MCKTQQVWSMIRWMVTWGCNNSSSYLWCAYIHFQILCYLASSSWQVYEVSTGEPYDNDGALQIGGFRINGGGWFCPTLTQNWRLMCCGIRSEKTVQRSWLLLGCTRRYPTYKNFNTFIKCVESSWAAVSTQGLKIIGTYFSCWHHDAYLCGPCGA